MASVCLAVHLSVRLSVPSWTHPQQQTHYCRFAAVGPAGRRHRSMDCCGSRVQQADAVGQCHVVSWHRKPCHFCVTDLFIYVMSVYRSAGARWTHVRRCFPSCGLCSRTVGVVVLRPHFITCCRFWVVCQQNLPASRMHSTSSSLQTSILGTLASYYLYNSFWLPGCPLVWKAWKCHEFWQLYCQGIDEISRGNIFLSWKTVCACVKFGAESVFGGLCVTVFKGFFYLLSYLEHFAVMF